MKEQQEMIEQMKRDEAEFNRRLEATKKEQLNAGNSEGVAKTTPQIRNLNADPALSGMFKYCFSGGDNTIGK